MHVAGISLDLNRFLQFIFTAFLVALGLLYLIKNTASKYFEVDATFEGTQNNTMPGLRLDESCVVCGASGSKKCSRCKEVRYCSQECQTKHWKYGHKEKCRLNSTQTVTSNHVSKASGFGGKSSSAIALVPVTGTSRLIKPPKKILFPYDEFVKLFNWDKPGFPPCGLVNCGNSCFANVVLQCLSCTRPLVAYLLENGHRRECRRNDWCFFCEFQTHVERARQSLHPFSPINILSRLPNIGGNLGYGRQEDAHEFMRFAIDTMQSVCLEEFGGEKAVDPSSQQTTLIQHIFGGHLQSQVICTKCNKISNQYENMMDLTVEIHGDVASLEECLDQFTVKEWLHGENMYKCDGCNDYVKAWKRLTVRRAPNILTIALKRFQSGRFGKLNKRVIFPETLDLSPYMSETGDGTDVYKLYSVVVHVDMLNASFFGHYICYTKDFCGNWYRIDDCKVTVVELDEVLSQGAYMLFYSRVCARQSCLRTTEPSKVEQHRAKVAVEPCPTEQGEQNEKSESINPISRSCDNGACLKASSCNGNDSGREEFEDMDVVRREASSSILKEGSSPKNNFFRNNSLAIDEDDKPDIDLVSSKFSVAQEVSECEKVSSSACIAIDSEAREYSEQMDSVNYKLISSAAKGTVLHNNHAQKIASPVEHTLHSVSSSMPSSICRNDMQNGNKVKGVETTEVDIVSSGALSSAQNGWSMAIDSDMRREDSEYMDMDNNTESNSSTAKGIELHSNGHAHTYQLVPGSIPSSNGTSLDHRTDVGDGTEANRIEIMNGIAN